jgi:preprotein translocase SecE subunit
VARPTRQARRERREQQRAAGENGGAADRARRPQQAVAAAPEAEVQPGVHHRGGVIGFIGECIAELKKVEWPGQKQVITGTVVVIVACTIVGLYLWGIDLVMKPLVQRLI